MTAGQMREIDRLTVDEVHVELLQMMENVGRSLADLVTAEFLPHAATVVARPRWQRRWGARSRSPYTTARWLHKPVSLAP